VRSGRGLIAAALLGMAGVVAAQAPAPQAPRVPLVTVGAATQGAGFELDGSLQAVRQSTVAAQVGGNVVQLAVQAGARVKAGQVLARIDERDAQAGLARSDAGVAQARAAAELARTHVQRQRDLRAQGFVSQAALDQAETEARAAQAALDQAQAGRAQAALARGFATVTAPFDGVVLATHVEAGELAAPGRPIVTIYQPQALRAVVQVSASRAAAARAARRVSVLLPGGETWTTPRQVTALPGTDPVSQTVEWRLDLTPTDAALQPGQTVRVRFEDVAAAAAPAGTAALRLPRAAVLRRGELTAVYVARAQRFVLQAVRTGPVAGDSVEVVAGLRPGQQVAADALAAGLAGATPAR
jgi:RND family efflux transporter MFP subunit